MKKRILVIDDEYTIRMVVHTTLAATAGWQVLEAATPTEGLTIAQTEEPDAILLDVMMPEFDGVEVFKKLQADARTRHIPVIFFTAKAGYNERKALEAEGTAGVIIKPFEPEDIANQMRAMLHWSN